MELREAQLNRQKAINEAEKAAIFEFQNNPEILISFKEELNHLISTPHKILKGSEVSSFQKIADMLSIFTIQKYSQYFENFYQNVFIMESLSNKKGQKIFTKQECKTILQQNPQLAGRCSKYKPIQKFIFGLYKEPILYYLKNSIYMTKKTNPEECKAYNNLPILKCQIPETKTFLITHGFKSKDPEQIEIKISEFTLHKMNHPETFIASTNKTKATEKYKCKTVYANPEKKDFYKQKILDLIAVLSTEEQHWIPKKKIEGKLFDDFGKEAKHFIKKCLDELVKEDIIKLRKNAYSLVQKQEEMSTPQIDFFQFESIENEEQDQLFNETQVFQQYDIQNTKEESKEKQKEEEGNDFLYEQASMDPFEDCDIFNSNDSFTEEFSL